MKVPKGWEVKKLKDICTISPPKSKKPINSKVSFIPMSGVCESGKLLNFEENNYDEVCKGFTSFIDNDVIIAKITPCFENGKGAIVSNLINGIGFGSTEFHVLRSKKNTEYKFIYYVTRTKKFIAKGKRNMQGSSGHRRIPADYLKTYKILAPPLAEQRKIAKILGCWDRAIATCEQLIATSKQQKQALMQQLLTAKKRFGEFTGEWEEVRLGDILTKLSNGLTYDTKATSGLPVSRIETISHGKIDHTKVGYASNTKNTITFKLKNGDILYSHINSLNHIGKVAYFYNDKDLYHGMNLLLLRTDNNNKSKFIYYILSSSVGKILAKSFAKRAINQASLSTVDIKKFILYIPRLPEQQKIAQVLTVADSKIEILQQKLAKLQQEKQALMQQLLTGKRRVKVDVNNKE